ncbi:YraN family protein [Sphingobacterium griseoflavum]|uniref:UPF0102 protein GCM10017764_33970 n=1 Tax=Sphingobacterium griseoflavum TaxID=1474952 RepID=A0ABQ3I2D8_9SPHI|nr:YraN family protein [Sphingobacterium griseoflavum]GHE48116.1 UPF0102 protein [Sphingobacterium griseoflavum]
MAKHLEDGKRGELLAADYLRSQGYVTVTTNWRDRYCEIDIIAKDGDTLVFVEVKSRTSTLFGEPDSFVDIRKQQLIIRAADAYLHVSGHEGEIRFDIVSVYLGQKNHIELIKDAFWSN